MAKKYEIVTVPKNEIVVYQSNATTRMEVAVQDETVWLTQAQIAKLFGTKRPAITKHLSNIYRDGELDKASTCSILEHMGNAGSQRYATMYYNLDVILAVGYRVNSKQATLFRRWATAVLHEYLFRGVAMTRQRDALAAEMDRRFANHEQRLAAVEQKVDFVVESALPAPEMVFMEGEFLTAHDRFIVCDNTVWICGSSIKDAGRRMFALVKTGLKPEVVFSALPA